VGAAAVAILLTLIAAFAAGLGGAASANDGATGAVAPPGEAPSSFALLDVPATYLQLYKEAAARYGLDWAMLAAVGKVECDHGRDPDPSCSKEGSVNGAGAGGPMQFLAATWARYGIDADGDGRADRWDAADAIFSAANYLRSSGAPGDERAALFAYNHSASYVGQVQEWAARYRGARAPLARPPIANLGAWSAGPDLALAAETRTVVSFIAGERASLDPGDGHIALVPTEAPATVQAMVVAGNELQTLPYGPGGHPDPRGAPEEDCSSTVSYVLYRSGVRPIAEIVRDNPLAQDYVHWGLPGPGRWVTIYATDVPTAHVFIVIAGLRLDTSHDGTDVGPNRDEDGPRWRILDRIPTWADWSVRHPPGL
jgi:hypothetical protein